MHDGDYDKEEILRDPDVRRMLRAKAGDQSAFEELVRTYQDRLVGWLGSIGLSADESEEVASDVFARIFKARHYYEPTVRFSTWMLGIASRLARGRRSEDGNWFGRGDHPGFPG